MIFQHLSPMLVFLSCINHLTRAISSSCVTIPTTFLIYITLFYYSKVKESRIQEAMSLFESAGFHLYSSNSNSPFSSAIRDDFLTIERTSKSTGAVLTRSIANIDTLPTPSCESVKPTSPLKFNDAPSTGQQSPRNKSHSPTSGEVRLLPPDLACVGLSDELGVDHWGLKIVKLVAFPDLIPSFRTITPSSLDPDLTDPYLLQSCLPPNFTSASTFHTSDNGDSDTSSDSGEDNGYFSHSPKNSSIVSLGSNTSRSYSDLPSISTSPKLTMSPSKHFVANIAPLTPILPKLQPLLPYSVPPFTGVSASSRSAVAKPDSRVPFFSFTRTPEGSSLTADVHLLATLFPPHERHMVICSGELDAADSRLEGEDSSDEYDSEYNEMSSRSNSLKCLQIDLRRFGLGMYTRLCSAFGIVHSAAVTLNNSNPLF